MNKISFFLFISLILIEFCVQKRIDIKPPEKSDLPSLEELFQEGKNQRLKFTSLGYREAIEFFQKTLDIDCRFYKSYPELTITYALWAKEKKDLQMDNINLWIKAYLYAEKAIELYPSPESLKAKAILCVAKNFLTEKEYNEIFQWTQSPTRRYDQERVIAYLKDLFYTERIPNKKEGLKYLEEVLSENPEDAEALIYKWIIESPGYKESEDLQKVSKIAPHLILPYFEMGEACLRMGKLDEAEKWFNEVLKLNPDHSRALNGLGEIYILKKLFCWKMEFLPVISI